MPKLTFQQQLAEHREDLDAWQQASDELRWSYASYRLDHPSRKPGSEAMGAEPPLRFSEFVAKAELEAQGAGPWEQLAQDVALQRVEQGEQPL